MTVDIDLTGVATPQELHARIRQALALPDWYGNNLDALYDVLSVRAELSVHFICAAQLRAAAPKYTAALERLCGDLSAETQGRNCTVENNGAIIEPQQEDSAENSGAAAELPQEDSAENKICP